MQTFLVLNHHCWNWKTPEGHHRHFRIQRLSPLSLPDLSFQHKVQMLSLALQLPMTLPLSILLFSLICHHHHLLPCARSLIYNSLGMSVTYHSLCRESACEAQKPKTSCVVPNSSSGCAHMCHLSHQKEGGNKRGWWLYQLRPRIWCNWGTWCHWKQQDETQHLNI